MIRKLFEKAQQQGEELGKLRDEEIRVLREENALLKTGFTQSHGAHKGLKRPAFKKQQEQQQASFKRWVEEAQEPA